MSSTRGGDQLPLPLPFTRRQEAERIARRTGQVVSGVVQVLLRWALRLVLPLVCAAAALRAFPYEATVQGVPFEVRGTLLSRPGLSADTTLGSWEFPEVSGVPFGVHISPVDVDVLQLTRLAGGDLPGFVERMQADFTAQLPRIATWLIAELLLGLVSGLLIAAAINMSVRYLRGRPRRPHELRYRSLQAAGAAAVTVTVAGYGMVSYNPNWVRDSQLTGTLAAAQLFPSELSAYYSQSNKALDVLGSVVGIQAALQAQIEDDQTPETALQIMTISDMHLSANYPLVARYAANYDVDLIVNAGDESAFGTRQELTPAYLEAVAALTETAPMLWVAGNHDSPATVEVMRSVPGVTVLGDKVATADGYAVTAGVVDAYGLTVAGLSDPRVYGGPGRYGADTADVVEPLQREAVREALGVLEDEEIPAGEEIVLDEAPADGAVAAGDGALAGDAPLAGDGAAVLDGIDAETGEPVDALETIDVFAVHEPVAAEEVREVLPGRVRQTVSGHVHAQNDSSEVQDEDGVIDLVEGSTGAGGLDNIVRGTARPPIEFSIVSVATDCQFTRVIRFSIESTQPVLVAPPTADSPRDFGDDVTASTVYFRPQDIDPDRLCSTGLGISEERPWPLPE
ncbi:MULTISPECIES: metallophosphoesterase [unclassified Modestobacter]|uniref:metallophosphoesterase n=1 Tax=unclassified Modestobacter TaxID=2643866 RepID=UPI0022AA0D86|nr:MULTISPECIES: metallophosphoesterase [unclassified Modestobacter]MCZ2813897.1 metallophosphoesterase [Modestobacter sp. VKM Ac-2979]MCZ2844128.1 metallophosphoesterase [Modestobacter sp. VKM Ac-2980]MCZ2849195.1 metallophosphoesterase [Modestobacter sp. VKM Ac-2978]